MWTSCFCDLHKLRSFQTIKESYMGTYDILPFSGTSWSSHRYPAVAVTLVRRTTVCPTPWWRGFVNGGRSSVYQPWPYSGELLVMWVYYLTEFLLFFKCHNNFKEVISVIQDLPTAGTFFKQDCAIKPAYVFFFCRDNNYFIIMITICRLFLD